MRRGACDIGSLDVCLTYRYDKKVQQTQKYMTSLGIDLLAAQNMSSLDKWEISRDRVVINRKLGEGAFGMVYGGEALFEDKGWVSFIRVSFQLGRNENPASYKFLFYRWLWQ